MGANVLKQKAQVSPGLGLLGYATGWAVYRMGWCAHQGKQEEVRDGLVWWHKGLLEGAKVTGQTGGRGAMRCGTCVYVG